MKKTITAIAALCLALFIAGCASGPSPVMVEVQGARTTRPDTLVGAASNADKNTSETRAKAQIVSALTSITRNMLSDFKAGGGNAVASDALEVAIIQALGRSRLSGIEKAKQLEEKKKGKTPATWWTVLYLNKASAQQEIKQIETALKGNIPGASSFSTDTFFERRFQEASAREWVSN